MSVHGNIKLSQDKSSGTYMIQLDAIAKLAPFARNANAFTSVGYNHGTPSTPIANDAKKTKKKLTATMPNLYESPCPFSERPRAIAMMVQQRLHAAAEVIMTRRRP